VPDISINLISYASSII